jgi:peptidoglycan/xylan/chitin deacetylase (PgdA/CDA1 family)
MTLTDSIAVVTWKRRILDAGRRTGAYRIAGGWYGPGRLTVLAYHRVVDRTVPEFATYRRNVSASPEAFAAQMDFVERQFNVVGLGDVTEWLAGGVSLPSRPLLITFDDGYRDNLVHAWPELRRRRLPMVLFLTTGPPDTGGALHWDVAAYCFRHTRRTEALLPVVGRRSWRTEAERDGVLDEFIATIKRHPDGRLRSAIGQLPDRLEVDVPADAFEGVYLNWSEIREMAEQGVAVGAHTIDHPILSRLDPEAAAAQVIGCRDRIAAELGRVPEGFAYPNGLPGDYDETVVDAVRKAGFRAAFTLSPGPARAGEARRAPWEIRRVYVGAKDHLSRFAAKLSGLARVAGLLR